MYVSMDLVKRAKRKAVINSCKYHVAAICFGKMMGSHRRGSRTSEFLGITTNEHRLLKKGGTIHAEIAALIDFNSRLEDVVLVRVNDNGKLCPIHPCKLCYDVLTQHFVRIWAVMPIDDENYTVIRCN